jgi:NADPH-dependent ferric siderophore reductase
MRRVVFGGRALDGLEIHEPASSVRVLFPPPGADALVMATWTGNQFELPTGERAPIRTFTPRHLDHGRDELTIDFVVHGHGLAADWARTAGLGDEVAVSGPARGHILDVDASAHLFAGDETAIPAISQLLEAAPAGKPVQVHVEIVDPDARIDLPSHPDAEVVWHVRADGAAPGDGFASAVEAIEELPESIWIAGEAAAVQRLRKYLFDVRGRTRSTVTARGYWKHGRSAT